MWPRDLVESAGRLLALGSVDEARNILRYLIATQHTEGSWSQNQWLGGKPFWRGQQLDEAAFPVLLAAALAERGARWGGRATARKPCGSATAALANPLCFDSPSASLS